MNFKISKKLFGGNQYLIYIFFSLDVINNHHRFLRRKIRQLPLPKNANFETGIPMCGFQQSNLICFLLNHSAHRFYQIRIPFFLFYFFFISLLIVFDSKPQHFHLSVLKNPGQPFQKKIKQNKKTQIKTAQNPLIKLSAKFGICTFM